MTSRPAGRAQQGPYSARAGAARQLPGAWLARSHGSAEAPQWPAPAGAPAAHSPHLSLGESGLGKLTLINSLFLTDLYSPEYPGPSHRIKKMVQVEQSKVLIKEGGVQLLLTIVDTPGFGDAVDNSNWPLHN
ncbi:septin-7-like [Macaca nemestrina]|uniref:septin-7-like n=1 Tax=Macaca nemestrina TaxID=9545 RepID=UPI0039B9B35F